MRSTQARAIIMPAGGGADECAAGSDGGDGFSGTAQALVQELARDGGGPSTKPILVREHSTGT